MSCLSSSGQTPSGGLLLSAHRHRFAFVKSNTTWLLFSSRWCRRRSISRKKCAHHQHDQFYTVQNTRESIAFMQKTRVDPVKNSASWKLRYASIDEVTEWRSAQRQSANNRHAINKRKLEAHRACVWGAARGPRGRRRMRHTVINQWPAARTWTRIPPGGAATVKMTRLLLVVQILLWLCHLVYSKYKHLYKTF